MNGDNQKWVVSFPYKQNAVVPPPSNKGTLSAKNSVLIREVSFGERAHHIVSHSASCQKSVSFIKGCPF